QVLNSLIFVSIGRVILYYLCPSKNRQPANSAMKKIHIVLLVMIAAAIAILIIFLQNTSTYDTVQTAMDKPGKYVHLMARWDKEQPMEYDALKDPNFLSFTAV